MQRYWEGVIEGIPLNDTDGEAAGFQIGGAGGFRRPYARRIVRGADGYPFVKAVVLSYGQELEINFLHIPGALLETVLDAIEATLPGGDELVCTFADGFQTITGRFIPGEKYYERGNPDGDYINDAIIRLIYRGA